MYPTTPDGRYFVVRGRLWRCTNPALAPADREHWVHLLMHARRAKAKAMQTGDASAKKQAKNDVHAAKVALGERGPVWWNDEAPDWNRHLVRNTPYAAWCEALDQQP